SRDSLVSISAQRHMEPAQLTKLVRGELDWIVMKALEKDRTRRYQTANGLARDLERYLADEPVAAWPPSAAYRLRKSAPEHRAAPGRRRGVPRPVGAGRDRPGDRAGRPEPGAAKNAGRPGRGGGGEGPGARRPGRPDG